MTFKLAIVSGIRLPHSERDRPPPIGSDRFGPPKHVDPLLCRHDAQIPGLCTAVPNVVRGEVVVQSLDERLAARSSDPSQGGIHRTCSAGFPWPRRLQVVADIHGMPASAVFDEPDRFGRISSASHHLVHRWQQSRAVLLPTDPRWIRPQRRAASRELSGLPARGRRREHSAPTLTRHRQPIGHAATS